MQTFYEFKHIHESHRKEPQVGFVDYEANLVFGLTFNLHLDLGTHEVNTDERGGEWKIGFDYSHPVFLWLKVKKTLSFTTLISLSYLLVNSSSGGVTPSK